MSVKNTDVSEVCTASIIRAMEVYFNETTRPYIPQYCYGLKAEDVLV
jgi:hypothetical protein